MPSEDKKARQSELTKETKELTRLLELLKTPTSKQQLPSLDYDPANINNNNNVLKSGNGAQRPAKSGSCQHQSSEAVALENFSTKYQNERNFGSHKHQELFDKIFSALVKSRLCQIEWSERAPPENIVRVLLCLRMLLRDQAYQKILFKSEGVKVLSEKLHIATESYLRNGQQPFMVDILKEMTNIFQKLASDEKQRELLIAYGAHKPLVLLLSASDVLVLHCSLYALISIAQSPEPRAVIGELDCIETLLRIIQEYDMLSKKLAAVLLRTLCLESQVKEQVKICDGVPVLLSVLHCDNIKLLLDVVWCIVLLSGDLDTSNDVRIMGGIPLLLSLLQGKHFTTDRMATSSLPSASSSGRIHSLNFPEETEEVQLSDIFTLQSACCSALTELVLNDTNGQQIVQNNGIYCLGMLIFPRATTSSREAEAMTNLQKNAFRTLRFLFSMERNRQMFKRLFPPDLFETFIDVGHYVKDINAYNSLVTLVNSLADEKVQEIQLTFQEVNQNKEPSKLISGYLVYEHLGTGAFGSVYKVKKNTGENFLALKEIRYNNPAVGKTVKEKDKSIDSIVSELSIIKEHLRHPNVVRYYRTFKENENLYIVMELIEGAPLYEHFNSLKEKGEQFSEERIWHIFLQIVLALRYLHKEKKIVHRDLTPNNIMLGENDKVTITDFGLARQKQPDASKMTSVVGTILYNCPEIIQNQPYGEKADVWAAGCILYQMCMLKPPFYSSNMLALASKIVEADYEPIPADKYSPLMISTIRQCLTADPDKRPDIVQVGGLIADIMMQNMDALRTNQISLEKKLDRERKRTQRHHNEATKNMQNYHRLFLASQERYDKLANLAGSGGASSIKSDSDSNDVFESSDEQPPPNRPHHIGLNGSRSRYGLHDTDKSVESGIEEDDSCLGCDSLDSSGSSSVLAVNRALAQQGLASPADTATPVTDRGRLLRSQSGSFLETLRRQSSNSGKPRPPSAAPTLTISPRKVRQISDPVLKMLHTIHKIIFICQLPPTLSPNPRRKVIERFKKALFAPQSSSVNLKNELKKLVNGSKELIDLNLCTTEASYLLKQASHEESHMQVSGEKPSIGTSLDPNDTEIGITYEQMQNFIESVLVESGYYAMSPNARNRSMPLGPIITSPPTLRRNSSYEVGST
ncbi:serine/threonine-protein kinase Nek10-like isoform X2 [Acanthaster planci]|uniref:Serine/threonine-protein kinase Nek10-like isoform X2 n=1 Tax=Acanthaster planci TaxID=133434 RepID=A0A8B7Y4E8_ACAPL|nr:serine/threonine-protein kinase Nek10-like isoform X2 [Acanthaster planci]